MANPRSESKTTALRLLVGARDSWRCFRCGHPIDPALRYPHKLSPTLEHVLPEGVTLTMWVAAGHDPYDPAHCTVSHASCNKSAGTRLRNLRAKGVGAQRTALTW